MLWALLAVVGSSCGDRAPTGGDAAAGARDAHADAADAALELADAGDADRATDAASPDAPAGGLIGAPCTHNGECQSAQCLTDEVAATLLLRVVHTHGGYCILFPCSGPECGAGAHCVDAEPFGANISICLEACGSQGECTRPGYECFFGPGVEAGPATGSCIPEGLFAFDAGT
ncbi:MAG: hypothetical protein HY906_04240 [Deltaproteobacteria bacterium]|nr:hypothetical protein [Deltaproteobacteria bacterium]